MIIKIICQLLGHQKDKKTKNKKKKTLENRSTILHTNNNELVHSYVVHYYNNMVLRT